MSTSTTRTTAPENPLPLPSHTSWSFPPGFTPQDMRKLDREDRLFDAILFMVKCVFLTCLVLVVMDHVASQTPNSIHLNFLVKHDTPMAKALAAVSPIYNPKDHSLFFDFTEPVVQEAFIQNETNNATNASEPLAI